MIDIGKLNQAVREVQGLVEQNRSAIEVAHGVANSPALKAIRAILVNSAVKQLLEDVERHRTLMRSVEGPLAELRRAGVFDPTRQLHEEFRKTQQMMAEFKARFTLPEVNAAVSLMSEFQRSPMAGVMKRYAEQASEIQRAMEAMRTPWLDARQALKSLRGFAELQGIGGMLARMATFDDHVSAALRVDLGDWRDKITWPKSVLTNLSERSEFYVSLGFDPSLTDFPAPAFQESVEIAGLRREPPSLVNTYGAPVPSADDEEGEEALVRTSVAHDWLLRLETNLRQFIDSQMIRAFGAEWPKYRLPNGLYEEWLRKQQEAEKESRGNWPLVAFAYFSDYERVICKKDNWREVFGGFFGRVESVRETFQRLHPIRVDTMHARPIGQEDELLLYIEVRRLIRVVVF